MAPKQTPPFRAEHVGSLLRPGYLLEARKKFNNKELTAGQLREVEDRAIAEAVDLQREVGIKGITDGEYRRHMFFNGFFESLKGIEEIPNPPLDVFRLYLSDLRGYATGDIKPTTALLCTSRIHYVKSAYVPHFEALKKLVHPDEIKNIKVTLASPEWLHIRHGKHVYAPGLYSNLEEFFNDIAAAFRQELAALRAAGCQNVQIDAPLLTFFLDPAVQKGFKDDGEDADALFDIYIRLYNNCLSGRPRGLTGGYDAIAKKLFNDLDVDCFYLEFDTPRAGTFEPLKYLPKHKSVVLGLITSKFPELEDREQLRERVFEAAEIIASGTGGTIEEALQQISVSPQCGFASHEEGNLLTAVDMKRKLELVRDVAASIWADA